MHWPAIFLREVFLNVLMSIWNQGKYHWEEHNANEWAKARLNELVNDIKIEGWELTDPNFSSISAARTIRKGREIRQYEIIFDTKFFTQDLETFTCLAFLSDGTNIISPSKLQMFPYFKN